MSGDSADEAAGEFGEAEYTALLPVSPLGSPVWMEFPRCFLRASLHPASSFVEKMNVKVVLAERNMTQGSAGLV